MIHSSHSTNNSWNFRNEMLPRLYIIHFLEHKMTGTTTKQHKANLDIEYNRYSLLVSTMQQIFNIGGDVNQRPFGPSTC
jgi:hypothetical protein